MGKKMVKARELKNIYYFKNCKLSVSAKEMDYSLVMIVLIPFQILLEASCGGC